MCIRDSYKAEVARYDVADADDDRKVYELSESRVVPLTDSGRGVPQAHVLTGVVSCLATIVDGEAANRLQKGDEVFAVYPDTTSFYHAVVSMPARRPRPRTRPSRAGAPTAPRARR